MKTCINSKLRRLTLERMVIGIEEPILVKGIGELLAKIDSGNSGYNVIHGEDFTIQGDILTFKTVNKDGDERRVSKKIKETLRVNIGGGHIQERPVVELDIKFGGDDYRKVPFSVTDRSGNEHKVLISKDFVGKELEALIDVTKDNIADDNIEVNYVTEGITDAIKKTAQAAGNIAKGAIYGTEGLQNFATKMSNFRNSMKGQVNLAEEVTSLGKMNDLIARDKDLIASQLRGQSNKLPPDFGATMDQEKSTTDSNGQTIVNRADNFESQKLLDYAGNTNIGAASSSPEYHARMKEVLAAYKDSVANEENEETIVTEAAPQPQPQSQFAPAPGISPAPKPTNKKKQVPDPTTEFQGAEGKKKVGNLTKEELVQELTKLKNRNKTIFYIIYFKEDVDGNQLTSGSNLTGGIQNIINDWSVKLVQEERWTKNAFTPFVEQMVRNMPKDAKGLFAICSGPLEARKVDFFTKPGLFYRPTTNDDLLEKYDDLNTKFQQLSGEELTDENLANYIASIQTP